MVSAALVIAALVLGSGTTVVATTPGATAKSTPGRADGGFDPGGIDGEAMRQRIIEEGGTGSAEWYQPSGDALRIKEHYYSAVPGNDYIAGAQRLPRPRARHTRELRVRGTLSTSPIRPTRIRPSREDDGSIPLARTVRLDRGQPGIRTTGRIGDGPHGSGGTESGDYDFYEFRARPGDALTVDVDPQGRLSPQAFLYDARGNLLVGALDQTGSGVVHLFHPIRTGGVYYAAIGAYPPGDPFDPGSGPAVLTEGDYRLEMRLRGAREDDTDLFAIALRKGDVLGATVHGSARRVAVHDDRGRLLQASGVDAGAIYPRASPLPRGGNATGSHIVDRTGVYYLSLRDGSGRYSLTVTLRHPGTRPPQTVLLDFTGPTFDNRILGASVVDPGVRDLSPMRFFLPRWGLDRTDERAVIRATTRRVEAILRKGIPGSKVRVVNSIRRPDLFGRPGVSRVIVGGTVAEAGVLDAFGLSESVDPGNFVREETAIVMPERMSDDDPRSLLPFLTRRSDRVRAVAQALGNTAGHEIGHFLGNSHTDDYDNPTSVMNTGTLLHFFAVGRDGVAGTRDDDRIAMRGSRYDPIQGFTGTQRTRVQMQVALR